MTTIRQCGTCKHYKLDNGHVRNSSECRRYPPVRMKHEPHPRFPVVAKHSYCGEYSANQAARAENAQKIYNQMKAAGHGASTASKVSTFQVFCLTVLILVLFALVYGVYEALR